jgi:hypothetical protein
MELGVQKRKLEEDLVQIGSELKLLLDRQGEVQKKLRKIIQQLSALKIKEPTVTDHAVLRYLERFRGINLEEIREEILTDERKEMILELGTIKLPLGENHRIIVKDGVVVTIK